MIDPLTVLIFSLATWRISSLLVVEDGPFFVFTNIRYLSGIRKYYDPLPASGEWVEKIDIPSNFFAQVLSCIWCCSLWVGLFWVALYFFFPVIAFYTALPFVLSTGTIVLYLVIEKLK